MALLFTILSTLLGAEINATVFGGVGLAFRTLIHDGGKEHKRHDLTEEQLQRASDKWNEDRMKRLDLINKRLPEQNKARAYINGTDEAMLEYYRIFAKKKSPYHLSPNYWIFIIHQRHKKMVNYYLLQLVQVLQHMLYISTLNK